MFYSVAKGRKPGIYSSWGECETQVKGFKGAKFKKFTTKKEALEFINPDTKKLDFIADYYVYTDGACSNNGSKYAKAGIGIYFGADDSRNTSERVIGRQTNNSAELTAIIKTYEIIKSDLLIGKKVCIASDSEYSIKCATTYGKRMAKTNWEKKIPNKELVKKIYELYGNNPSVIFKHVRAHTLNSDVHSIGNEHADRLANKAIGLYECPYSKK